MGKVPPSSKYIDKIKVHIPISVHLYLTFSTILAVYYIPIHGLQKFIPACTSFDFFEPNDDAFTTECIN